MPVGGFAVRALVAATLVFAAVPGWQPAYAAGCTGGTGVTVVVDYGPYGGVQTGCAANPSDGFSALSQAGFSVTPVQRQPGFVCRINGVPADDACVVTPPADAYWSYWQESGGGWRSSSLGAGSTNPGAGDTEGWAFGAGAPPGIAPPANAAPPATTTNRPPPPPPPPTTAPAPPPAEPSTADPPRADPPRSDLPRTDLPRAEGTAPGPTPPAADGSTPDPTGAPAEPSGTSPTTMAATASGERSASPGDTALSPAGSDAPASGPPWGTLFALVAAAALGGGAWWQVRRRQ